MEIAPLDRAAPVLAPTPAVDLERAAENRELIQAVKAVNGAELFGANHELTFAVDRSTQRAVIRLVDRETRDVIRQIPPEYVLRAAEDLGLGEQP
jgi:flagellar protein FlaG